jgi:DNA repair protein RecO (recombination protein O)
MPLASDACICLRKFEYSETSQILTLLSRDHGLLRVIAKGAHRQTKAGASKFDGGIDLLDSGDGVFTDDPARELATLTEWKLRDGHLHLRRALRGLYLGLYGAELIATLFEEHDAHPEVFDRFAAAIPMLETDRREEHFLSLELDLLQHSGYLPELSRCLNCNAELRNARAAFFSASRGGVLCASCESGFPDRERLDPRLLGIAVTALRLPRENNLPQRLPRLTRHQTDPLNRLLASHIEHTASRRLRLAPWVAPRGQLGRRANHTATPAPDGAIPIA